MFLVRRIIFLSIIGFGLGVSLGSLFDFGWPLAGLFFILFLNFICLFFLDRQKKVFLFIAIICLAVVSGFLRLTFISGSNTSLACASSCSGLIVTNPDRRDANTRLVFRPDNSSEQVLIITDNFIDYRYGDRVEIIGKIQVPENFLTQSSSGQTTRVFDYQNYLAVRGITKIVYRPEIKVVAQDQGFFLKAWLFEVKNNFLGNLRQVLSEPQATLAGGLILGDKGGLGKLVEDEFRQAGVSHIIVLSGYNITIVAESVLKFFSWLSPAFAWVLGIFSIFLFVLMTGGEAAAVRSAMMGAIALIARRYGRSYDAGVALIVAGFLMVLWNPRLLIFDLGFQLSFLATLGLIYLSPVVDRIIECFTKSKMLGLRELIITTTGAQIAVYPWLLYKMGNATLIGFISNIFILPAVPLAMLGSFLTGISGFISFYFSLLISYPTYFLLEYILWGARFFANLF